MSFGHKLWSLLHYYSETVENQNNFQEIIKSWNGVICSCHIVTYDFICLTIDCRNKLF